MISKYREDKIKAEFRKLESDLKAQDQKNALEKQRAKEKRGYQERQRKKTNELNQRNQSSIDRDEAEKH